MAEIGKRGQARRRELGLSVGALAQRLGCTRDRVYNLECYGAGMISTVERWAVALEMPPGELAFGTAPKAVLAQARGTLPTRRVCTMKFRVCRPHELAQGLGIYDDDAWHEVESTDAEAAAEAHAWDLCSRDPECYSSFNGDGEIMLVRGPESTVAVRVSAEMVPSFSARRVR